MGEEYSVVKTNIIVHSSLNISFQMSGQKQSTGSQQPSSGLLHKFTDAVTGQKHPQDYQNQTGDNEGAHNVNQGGFGGNRGGHEGYQGGYGENRGGHGGYEGGYGGYRGGHEGYQGGYGGNRGGHEGYQGGYGGNRGGHG